jgi:aminoglycoside phosphotransferase (APT) family kinase protein
MNAELVRFLVPLQQALAAPAIGALADEGLRRQLQNVHRLIAWLHACEAVQPPLEHAMLREIVAAIDGIEPVMTASRLPVDAVRRLRALAAQPQAPDLETILAGARDLQNQLCALGDEPARTLRRKLVEIETGLSRAMDAALAHNVAAPPASAEGGGAANTRVIDEAKLNAWLARAFPEEPELRLARYVFIAGGHSKYTARLQLTGARKLPSALILRGDGRGTYGGKSVVDEYRLLDVMHRHGVSVPRPLALDESGQVFGTPSMLVEEVAGRVIGHMFDLPAPNADISRDVAVQLARIHRVPLGEFDAQAIGAARSNREQALQWINESYASFKALDRASPIYETAFHWLREQIALVDGPRCLVHGDCGLNNLMIDKGRVTTLLDWEFAFAGNPFYDLGYFYYQAEHLGGWDDFLQAYRQAGGEAPTQEQLDYQVLFATTRLGVMVMQTEAAVASGLLQSLGGAVACTGYHDVSVIRMARVLERVL